MRNRMAKWMISSIPLTTVATKTPTRGCACVVCEHAYTYSWVVRIEMTVGSILEYEYSQQKVRYRKHSTFSTWSKFKIIMANPKVLRMSFFCNS